MWQCNYSSTVDEKGKDKLIKEISQLRAQSVSLTGQQKSEADDEIH